jgi:hypothetical protein
MKTEYIALYIQFLGFIIRCIYENHQVAKVYKKVLHFVSYLRLNLSTSESSIVLPRFGKGIVFGPLAYN